MEWPQGLAACVSWVRTHCTFCAAGAGCSEATHRWGTSLPPNAPQLFPQIPPRSCSHAPAGTSALSAHRCAALGPLRVMHRCGTGTKEGRLVQRRVVRRRRNLDAPMGHGCGHQAPMALGTPSCCGLLQGTQALRLVGHKTSGIPHGFPLWRRPGGCMQTTVRPTCAPARLTFCGGHGMAERGTGE